MKSASKWAQDAASLPLAFSQVREDPRLDLTLASELTAGETVVMIASGGETAICLGERPLKLHLVDMNPAQLAISKLKWHLALTSSVDDAMRLLGHLPMEISKRRHALDEILNELNLPVDIFGDPDFVSSVGVDHAGRYEVTFSKLREALGPERDKITGLLSCDVGISDPGAIGDAMDAAFREVMSLENLVCLFGEGATQNPRRPFHEHFATRTRLALGRSSPAENPFLWQILAGHFPSGNPYDWLKRQSHSAPPLTRDVQWHLGTMVDVLDSMPPDEAGIVHLSNILDWLGKDDGEETLMAAYRVLKPGGKVMIRQLNSTLDICALRSDFVWNLDLGQRLEKMDRSYFYPGIFVGEKR